MNTTFWRKDAAFQPDWRQPTKVVENVVFEMKKRGMSDVLEVGCGRGRNCLYLAREGLSVTGVDFSYRDLSVFKKYATALSLRARIVQADVSELPFRGATFDVVLFLHVLTFVRERARSCAAEEASRVLRGGGLVVAIERSQRDPLYQKGEQLEKDTFAYEGVIHHFFSREELEQLFSPLRVAALRESLKIDTVHGPHHLHGMWYCVALKE